MNVLVATNERFAVTPDGSVWSSRASYGYEFWRRYLDVFEAVLPLARTNSAAEPPPRWVPVTGAGVSPILLPDFAGIPAFAGAYPRLRAVVRRALWGDAAVVLRAPSVVASAVDRALRTDRPRAVEVCADPFDELAPGSSRHPLRSLLRFATVRLLRRQCLRACGVAYVTEDALQRRYPARPEALSTHYSSVMVDGFLVPAPRPAGDAPAPMRLISVTRFDQLHKAPDVLIDAVGRCVGRGVELALTFVGAGRHEDEMKARTAGLGLAARIRFLGHVSAATVLHRELDGADLFVLPSRHEGLPRAMIEAMARGLPCIGSTIGGIPELLPAEDLVSPGDAPSLARKIAELAADPQRLARMSARNLERARDFTEARLQARRAALYRHLRDRSAEWAATR